MPAVLRPALFGLLLLVSMLLCLGVGTVSIPADRVAGILSSLITGAAQGDWTSGQYHIVVDLRLSRILIGAFAGGGLAMVGAVLQSMTRNPLADPYLFGIASGAAVGAVAVLLYTGPFLGSLTLPLLAFAGALGTMALVFGVAHGSDGLSAQRMLLTGVGVHFVLMAIVNFMILAASDRGADTALFWMLGGFGNARWPLVLPVIGVTLLGSAWIMARGAALDALSLGDEGAHTLGVDVSRLRLEMFVVTALITGTIVAACGAVGFIGLVVPHVARWMVGGRTRRLVPCCALIGALFAIWVDAGARAALAPKELPLGVVTAAIGGLFFLFFLRRQRRLR